MNGLKLYAKALMDRYIYFVPIILLIATLFSNFFDFNPILAGNSVGYGICVNLPMFYLFNFKGSYCWFTKNATIGLIIINIFDIIGLFLPYATYKFWFEVIICSTIIILALIFYIRKKIYR